MKDIQNQLKMHEGFRKYPYRDSEGYMTIGYGWNLEAKGLPRDIALILLKREIKRIKKELDRYDWYLALSPVRRKVIIDMSYNLGVDGMLGFKKMVAAIKEKDYEKAADEMLDSLWADQVGERADRLAKMMRTNKDYKE